MTDQEPPQQPPQPPYPYHQPPQIIIRQETSTGTKVGIWLLVVILGGPLLLCMMSLAQSKGLH